MLKDKKSKEAAIRFFSGLALALLLNRRIDYTDVVSTLRSLADDIELNSTLGQS